MKSRFAALTIACAIGAAPRAQNALPPPELDIAYGADPAQRLDLYLPARKPFATIVYTYGGGWHSGSGKSSTPIAQKLQELGYACALVTHRLSPPFTFPAHAEDLASAFAWVASHIAARGGDPKRLVLAGHSSGAHLSALLATDSKYLAAHGLSPRDVRAVVAVSPPVDLTQHPNGRGYGDALMGGAGADAFGRDPSVMRDASPLFHISRDMPPMLLLVGDHDFPMLPEDVKTFAARATAAGAVVETGLITGRDHMGMASGLLDEHDPVLRRVLLFLERHGA